jgi:hypothetical protein
VLARGQSEKPFNYVRVTFLSSASGGHQRLRDEPKTRCTARFELPATHERRSYTAVHPVPGVLFSSVRVDLEGKLPGTTANVSGRNAALPSRDVRQAADSLMSVVMMDIVLCHILGGELQGRSW